MRFSQRLAEISGAWHQTRTGLVWFQPDTNRPVADRLPLSLVHITLSHKGNDIPNCNSALGSKTIVRRR